MSNPIAKDKVRLLLGQRSAYQPLPLQDFSLEMILFKRSQDNVCFQGWCG